MQNVFRGISWCDNRQGTRIKFWNDENMEQSSQGLLLIFIGVILFAISLFIVLLLLDLYLISLAAMFISVVVIAVGFAKTKSDDSTIESTE